MQSVSNPANDLPPLVLVHGMLGFGDVGVGKLRYSYFRHIDTALARRGHIILRPRVHPLGGVVRRATELRDAVLPQLEKLGRKVIFVGHSLGGLDCRYAIRHLGLHAYASALLTVTTPHHGSVFADWMAGNLGQKLHANQTAARLGLDIGSLQDVRVEAMAGFNREVPDHPDVAYFSVSCFRSNWYQLTPILVPSWRMIRSVEGPNDGWVSVASSTWGRHLADWECDHFHSVNKRFVPRPIDQTGDVTGLWVSAVGHVTEQIASLGGTGGEIGARVG